MPKFNLEAVITADDRASGKIRKTGDSFKKFAKTLGTVGVAAAGAAIAIGVKAVKAAASFETQMANVSTLIDEGTENIIAMGDSVLELSKKMPVTADELATALYSVRSAGIDAADAMDVLEESAKLAVAGLGTTDEAVDLVTSSLNAFSSQGWKAKQITDIIFTAVKRGKTTVAELAQGFGAVAGQVEAAGIQLDDYFSAIAAITTQGVPAAQAHTMIRAALSGLTRETEDSIAIFTKLGVKTFPELIEKSGGITAAFKELVTATDGNDAQLLKLVGSTEALNAILSLTGSTNEAYVDTLADMRDGAANIDEAFREQTNTFDSQYKMLVNFLNVELIKLGSKILPEINNFMQEALMPTIQFLTGDFDALAKNTAAVNERYEKLLLVWYTVIETGRIIKGIFVGIINVLTWLISPMVRGIDEMINFRNTWTRNWNVIRANVEFAVRSVIENINKVINKARQMKDALQQAPQRALSGIRGFLGFQGGGIVPETGIAMLHKGERVVPSEFVTNNDNGVVVNFYGSINNTSNASLDDIGERISRQITLNRQGAA